MSHRRPYPRRRALEALICAALLAAVAVSTAAPSAAEREQLTREARWLVGLPYGEFALARRGEAFDWSTDGCSHTPAVLAARFAGPCRQHDFAYRNLGRGLRLGSDETTRRWVDARFLEELRRRCAEGFRGLRLRLLPVHRSRDVGGGRRGPRWRR